MPNTSDLQTPDPQPLLLLFDVDGTLIKDLVGAKKVLTEAVTYITDVPVDMTEHSFDGKTDPQNAYELLQLAEIPERESRSLVPTVIQTFLLKMEIKLADVKAELLPGIDKLLNILKEDSSVYLGLLTGNSERGAELKLQSTNLMNFFSFGAYGSDNPDRYALPQVAQSKAFDLFNIHFQPHQIAVIGDTVHDVGCANEFGAVSIAVLTGPSSHQIEGRVSPDLLFDDLLDTERFLQVIQQIRHQNN